MDLIAAPAPAQAQHVGDDLMADAARRGPVGSSIAITTWSAVTAVTLNPPLTWSGTACSEW